MLGGGGEASSEAPPSVIALGGGGEASPDPPVGGADVGEDSPGEDSPGEDSPGEILAGVDRAGVLLLIVDCVLLVEDGAAPLLPLAVCECDGSPPAVAVHPDLPTRFCDRGTSAKINFQNVLRETSLSREPTSGNLPFA